MGASEGGLPAANALGNGVSADDRAAATGAVIGIGINGETLRNGINVVRIETVAISSQQIVDRPAIVMGRHGGTT